MSTLLFDLNHDAVESDEEHVRSTITVVDENEPSAVADETPRTVIGHDPDTGGGLTTRDLASHVRPSEQYVPDVGNANADLTGSIDAQVSTSGTAAAREERGEWGHGTIHVQDATEVPWQDGTEMREDYFAANTRAVQDGTGAYMTASRNPDDGTAAAVQQAAQHATREAANAAALERFYAAVTQ